MTQTARRFRCWVVAMLSLAACAGAAGADVFQCKDAAGKITYTNVPCAGQTPKAAPLEASAYATPYGVWLGQIQYKETTPKGAAAKAVAPLTLMIESGGRLTGASNETGCRALGIASPSVTANVLSLDVTLSNCLDAGFNRHYNGSLALYPADKSTQLMLISSPSPLIPQPATYDLRGTMRR